MLAKWLGDMGADSMASMIGSESMTSSDWMLLALSSIGQDSQKKVGEAFVQVGADRFGEGVVGGVTDQQVAEAVAVVSR